MDELVGVLGKRDIREKKGCHMYRKIFETQFLGFEENLKILKRAPQTLREYQLHISHFLRWLIKREIFDLKDVDEAMIREYQSFINQKGYVPHTIHIKLRSIKRFFEYLEKTNHLLYNPAERIIYPSLGDRLPKYVLSEEQTRRLLNAPNTSTPIGIRDKTIYELMYSTGIRLEECIRLTIHDVDYQGGYLRVNLGKGRKDRVVPIGKKACDYVKEYLHKVRFKYLKEADERALFLTKDGDAMTKKALRARVRMHAKRAGIKENVSPHAFRRAFATHMLKNDAHPVYIQRILGHTDSTVLNRYIKIAGVDLKKTHRKSHPRA